MDEPFGRIPTPTPLTNGTVSPVNKPSETISQLNLLSCPHFADAATPSATTAELRESLQIHLRVPRASPEV